ncbi:cyclic nucleotide-gated channel rod photoreceptor subunit alpha-like [Orbicella faveolata]|uniref:cyclic nucleotide-gated channel rod photoreceptor subunit alpha-like n=1 Tax=Orbicella faveolata TaxID=48498 RepID=UPI0009E3D551|nr:cyclic nucleotide-gated channel rod photoreceptor subunit alpha-like [Orbicella faveolata]
MSATWNKQVQVTFSGVSLANEEINIQKFPFVINPRSRLFRHWETVSSIFIFLTCLIVPYQASFDSQSSTLWALAYIFDALYLVDVSLRFLVGYFSKGTLITDRSLIRRRYLRGMFIPDLLTLLPLDLLAFGVGTHLRWHQTLTLLRLNRILRVLRLLSFFGARENELGTNTPLIRALKDASIGTITIHLMSCAWYSLACPNIGAAETSCDAESWAVKLKTVNLRHNYFYRYLSFSLQRNMEISPDVRYRVLAYYEYLWTHNHGVSGVGMFNDLPLTLQAELSLMINKKVLEKAPLFRGLNPGFKRMLSLVIRPVFYMPNQIIASKGDIGHHMFYIHRGRAEILCENESTVLVTMNEGKLFGEHYFQVSMVYNFPRSASVRAAAPCVIFVLDRADLNRVLKHYPGGGF